MDKFSALETFIRVYEAGSFSKAAHHLRLGQPAVSKIIAQLESHLGTQLLLRSTRGLAPTEAGEKFYLNARATLEKLQEAEHSVKAISNEISGKLKIAAAVTFSRLHIIPHLGSFMKRFPQLEIEILLDDRSIDLIEEGVDISLRMGSLPDSTMVARKLCSNSRLVIGSKAYFEQHGGIPTHPSQLAKYPAIIHTLINSQNKLVSSLWPFTKDTITETVPLQGTLYLNAAEGIRAAVKAHLGLAVASEWMFRSELESQELISVLNDWQLPSIDLWAVFPPGRNINTKTRAFLSYLEEIL